MFSYYAETKQLVFLVLLFLFLGLWKIVDIIIWLLQTIYGLF